MHSTWPGAPDWWDSLVALRDDSPPRAFEVMESIATEVGPRLAGSPGDARAVAWGVARLEAEGFRNVRAEPVTVPRWTRRAESGAILDTSGETPLALTALGGSVATPPEGLVAEVVRFDSVESLEAADATVVTGKLVFVDKPIPRAADGHGYREGFRVRGVGASVASERGAIGYLMRSLGTESSRFPHTGVMRVPPGSRRIPAAALSTLDADALTARLAAGPVRVRLTLDCGDDGEAQSANVVGEVPGTDLADEIVLLGAHLDSWDLGRGAIDDGAGIGIIVDAAQRIAHARVPPRRTVRVVFFAAEENSGAGADQYRVAHADELRRHVFALEADFGDGAPRELRTRTTPESLARWNVYAQAVRPLGVQWVAGAPHGGADVSELGDGGVTLVDLRQDGTRYFDVHHTARDVVEIIHRDELELAARAVAALAYVAAMEER